ncbi:hypothetical protein PQY66_01605 [Luminiphilus sp.]|jgi:hypothetical protein|nr:hypothetical protein [Luminiphilus sp.]
MKILKVCFTAFATSAVLTGCGGGGGGSSAPAVITPPVVTTPAAPTVDLSTDQTAVTSGDTFTLTWSSTDATACEASGSWTGSLGTSGSSAQQAYGIGERSFSITCSGDGGDSPSSEVVIQFEISPAQQASAAAVSAAFSVF